jgi:predicted lipoprotein with Yx(FWY)xxD motif
MAKPVTLQMTNNDTLGKFIADGDGHTLYLFTKDTKGTSNCYDNCATAWPPVIPEGAPTLNEGIDSALISTTVRTDGSAQLTYNGWPLYYYAEDTAPGDTVGQAVGNVWWVVSGEGNPIKPASVALTQTEKLGTVLVDGSGMALYLFTRDTPGVSNCYGNCEIAWPPLLTLDQPTLGEGIAADMISSTLRNDGSMQLTYNGWPLYYYFKDVVPGDLTGQAVGGVWWVVSPAGSPIEPVTVGMTQTAQLGPILVDGAGRTLYAFTNDTPDTSTCYNQCATNWPPLLQSIDSQAGEGADAAMLGVATRTDGTLQVTYNGLPLYYYVGDQAVGDAAGQGVGGVWYVIAPDGQLMK